VRRDIGLFFYFQKGGGVLRKRIKMTVVSFMILSVMLCVVWVIFFGTVKVMAAELPSPDSVLLSYRDNPYLRFYEGNEGVAWTTIHPGGYALTGDGTYIYAGGQSIYREEEGRTVIPQGVVTRREIIGELPPGHHYYAAAVTDSVVPVGKWVLMHNDARCVHGPFDACCTYEYYGISGLSNLKCGEEYDSGWIAYCADCGAPLTGYVYTCEDCISRIGYIFTGSGTFSYHYPVEYLFICPLRGDNLENDFSLRSHMCKAFVSCNRYNVIYDGNGASYGEMEPSVFYYGGENVYEGVQVTREECLRENTFVRPGYRFSGWSDSPDGQVLFSDRAHCSSLESYYTALSASGDGTDDMSVILYAVWEKCDSVLTVSGGNFGDNAGAYNGVASGLFFDGLNRFEKGYMYETAVSASDLTAPSGYRVGLNAMQGTSVNEVYASCELIGWDFESDDADASPASYGSVGSISISGRISGSLRAVSSDGSFTYQHISPVNGNTDHVTALWKSTSVILPGAVCRGMIFVGWYTDPDMKPEHFAGGEGDLFTPDHDTELYASFTGIDLMAVPDYMGNDTFGALRYNGLTSLSVPEVMGKDVFRYYISPDVYPYAFTECFSGTDVHEVSGSVRTFSGQGECSYFTADRTGVYVFELWGACGASYGEYVGEKGESSSCRIFLRKGDVVGVYTGLPGVYENTQDGIVCNGGEGSYISINGNVVMSSSGGKGASYNLHVSNTYEYTGSVRTFTAEAEGDYTLEVWGAAGTRAGDGKSGPGSGGYASGVVHLTEGSVLYICAGGSNGYNGGGYGGSDRYGSRGGNGGGATHIASADGLLSGLSGNRESVYIVAGGGGGAGGSQSSAGTGGGAVGGTGISPWPGGQGSASGGSQSAPGGSGSGRGGFGYGGRGYSVEDNDYPFNMNGGGGGGWYGGGGGIVTAESYGCGGGGGSGYIGGVEEGVLRSGVNSGNGYAVISCEVCINGLDPVGRETGFFPEGFVYGDHVIVSHSECVYPGEDIEGAGYCRITEPDDTYYGSSSALCYSPDTEAPDAVSRIGMEYDAAGRKLDLLWDMPSDNGTIYAYMARAYSSSDIISGNDDYAQSDIRKLCIATGVYGYYYLIDDSASRDAGYVLDNGVRLDTAWTYLSGRSADSDFASWYDAADPGQKRCRDVSIVPDGSDRYIHLICVDRAGNVSPVFDAAVDGDGAFIPYPIVTDKLCVKDTECVYASEDRADTYYVRADGSGSVLLEYSAYIDGFARDAYQIDTAYFHSSLSEYVNISVEKSDRDEYETSPVVISSERTSGFPLIPVSCDDVLRTDFGRRLLLTESFSISTESEVYLYPSASATMETGDASVSSRERDILNGITLIGDAKGPECLVSINGGEYIPLSGSNISNVAALNAIDRRGEDVMVDLYVRDEGSGLKGNFVIRIVNTDNGLEEEFESDGEHFVMNLKMDPDSEEPLFENMLFNGRFIIFVYSEDNVGNTGSDNSENITELDVKGEICRTLDEITGPLTDDEGNTVIKRGESGYVLSNVWGYPDAVYVSFEDDELKTYDVLYIVNGGIPESLSGYSGTVEYIGRSDHVLTERTDFTVPLEYDGSVINVSITAYRGNESLTWETACNIVSDGTVLDELITVLR
jgi:hypothetical protein